jgi:hypothetical protein
MPRSNPIKALSFSRSIVPSFPLATDPEKMRAFVFLSCGLVGRCRNGPLAALMRPAVFAARVHVASYACYSTHSTRLPSCTIDDCDAREKFLETRAVYCFAAIPPRQEVCVTLLRLQRFQRSGWCARCALLPFSFVRVQLQHSSRAHPTRSVYHLAALY